MGCDINIDVVSIAVEAYAMNDANKTICISTHLIMPSKKISSVYKCTSTKNYTCMRKKLEKCNPIFPYFST